MRSRTDMFMHLSLGLAITAAAGCLADPEDDLGTTREGLTGQTSIDSFTRAFDALTTAGVALPTTEQVIDLGTCDLSDPLEPSWTDVMGGNGRRYWDDFKRIYRTSTSPRFGEFQSTAATVQLRVAYIGLQTTATGTMTPKKVTYQKDAAGNSVEDPAVYYLPDGRYDLVRTSQPSCDGSQDALDRGCLPALRATASAGNPTATFTVTSGNRLDWSLPCGAISMRGSARLIRPVHVGQVKIAALPVGIIYEPDWPAGAGSYAFGFQEVGATIGSTVSTTVRREDTAQDFKVETSSLNQARGALGALGTVVSKAPFGGASTVGGIISALGSGLGTESTNVFNGAVNETTASVQTTYSQFERRQTNEMPYVTPVGELGLGKRDLICWLHNVTVGYVWLDGYLRMIPAGYEMAVCEHAFRIRQQVDLLRQRLSCKFYSIFNRPSWCTRQASELPGTLTDLEAVLAIDPFVADPTFRPQTDPGRFAGCEDRYEPDLEYKWSEDHLGTTSAIGATWTSRTVQKTPGWLSIIGLGPQSSVNTTLKTTHSRLRQTTSGSSVGTGFKLYKNGGGHAFTLCHDTAFTSALAVPRP